MNANQEFLAQALGRPPRPVQDLTKAMAADIASGGQTSFFSILRELFWSGPDDDARDLWRNGAVVSAESVMAESSLFYPKGAAVGRAVVVFDTSGGKTEEELKDLAADLQDSGALGALMPSDAPVNESRLLPRESSSSDTCFVAKILVQRPRLPGPILDKEWSLPCLVQAGKPGSTRIELLPAGWFTAEHGRNPFTRDPC